MKALLLALAISLATLAQAQPKIEDLGDFSMMCMPAPRETYSPVHLNFLRDDDYITTHRVQMKSPVDVECLPALRMKDKEGFVSGDEWTATNIFLRCYLDKDQRKQLDTHQLMLNLNRVTGVLSRAMSFAPDRIYGCSVRELTDVTEEVPTKF